MAENLLHHRVLITHQTHGEPNTTHAHTKPDTLCIMEKSGAVTTAFLLGAGGGTCLSLSMSPSVSPFAIYVVLLVTFHVSEYVLAGAYRPDTASHDSFLLQHSRAYQLMVLVCWLEYWLEWFGGAQPWPGWKEWGAVPSVGLVVCSAGLLARAVGIATASSNFSHQIEEQKRDGHRLVTHGIYSFLRHPAYFGFFWWSAGSQILLVNPIWCVRCRPPAGAQAPHARRARRR